MSKINKVIIGAPFGNYLTFPACTSTIGTFTALPRGGCLKRLWRIIKTVRYYPGIQAWKNKLGLPNPGIKSITKNSNLCRDKIVSIAGFSESDWVYCLENILTLGVKPLAVELNVSCPNVPGQANINYYKTFQVLKKVAGSLELIVKLPPLGYERLIEAAIFAGIHSFHCCNTLPTPNGGLSGKPLKELSIACINYLHKKDWPSRLIGGGGITHLKDALDYREVLCHHFAVASVLFNPVNWPRVGKMALDLDTM